MEFGETMYITRYIYGTKCVRVVYACVGNFLWGFFGICSTKNQLVKNDQYVDGN